MIADHHGNVCHLFERDCSVQRRHQKLIEEAPSPNLPEDRRKAICDAAVRMIRGADYTNAATVEFIVDADNNFYFIEVNARIQVEHPVSEMITGVDLIKTQIRVAAGAAAAVSPRRPEVHWARDRMPHQRREPAEKLSAQSGQDSKLFTPGGLGVRFDSHVYGGYTVPPHYDSMIGKLIVHRPSREEAIATMRRALMEMQVEGIATTASFHDRVLQHPAFIQGKHDTKFVERELMN